MDYGWFNQPHLARVRRIGLWGWLRLHTCFALSNQTTGLLYLVLHVATRLSLSVCGDGWFNLLHIDFGAQCTTGVQPHPAPESKSV